MCWEQRFTVSLARAIAALQLLPSARCLTHTSAALVQGLAMWTHEPDVYIAVPSNPRMTTMRLPLFRFPVSGVPKPIDRVEPDDRRVLLRRRRLDLADDEIRIVGGVPVTHALRTAFDCACDEPPFNALSIADSALRQYCRPDPWNRESCRDRENEARAYWDGLASRYRGRKGIVQARAVLAAASPWAVLPGRACCAGWFLSWGCLSRLSNTGSIPARVSASSTCAGPGSALLWSLTAVSSTRPRRMFSSRSSVRTTSKRRDGSSCALRGRTCARCVRRPIGSSRCSPEEWLPASSRFPICREPGCGDPGLKLSWCHEALRSEHSEVLEVLYVSSGDRRGPARRGPPYSGARERVTPDGAAAGDAAVVLGHSGARGPDEFDRAG